jgi:ankyrin repeat protein
VGGRTVLDWAGTKEAAELLLNNGADLNAKGKNGISPLDMAALGSSRAVTKILF